MSPARLLPCFGIDLKGMRGQAQLRASCLPGETSRVLDQRTVEAVTTLWTMSLPTNFSLRRIPLTNGTQTISIEAWPLRRVAGYLGRNVGGSLRNAGEEEMALTMEPARLDFRQTSGARKGGLWLSLSQLIPTRTKSDMLLITARTLGMQCMLTLGKGRDTPCYPIVPGPKVGQRKANLLLIYFATAIGHGQ